MKHFILLLAALAMLTACGTSRRVSAADGTPSWEGRTTAEILRAMGDPDRIDPDGKGGSIIRYEAQPNYDDPSYDILDPESSPEVKGHADFYVNQEGICYRVDSNRVLPAPPSTPRPVIVGSFWLDMLVYLPLVLLILI